MANVVVQTPSKRTLRDRLLAVHQPTVTDSPVKALIINRTKNTR